MGPTNRYKLYNQAPCPYTPLPLYTQAVVQQHEVLRGHFTQDADGRLCAVLTAADAFDLHMDIVDLRLAREAQALAVMQVGRGPHGLI